MSSVLGVISETAPDILVLADFDYDADNLALNALADAVGSFPYRFARTPNRGIQAGFDADGDGRFGEPEDAQGYGRFSGDGALAILSKYPLIEDQVFDYSDVLWTSLADSTAPEGTDSNQRLSTTAHWQVPIQITDGDPLHLLTWHATAPVFDGADDRNGWRNHDEAAFWLNWLEQSPQGVPFVLAGIANVDPIDGEGRRDALHALLNHSRLQDPQPMSRGGATSADRGANETHKGNPALDTVDWPDEGRGPGNLRVTYLLPSTAFTILDSGVLWPDDATTSLGRDVRAASRHRLVWVDLRFESH